MKRKKLICILLAAAAILCAVIFRKPVYSEPPELTVRSGEETLIVPGSATSWKYQKFGGGWVSYESGLKPVDLQGVHPALESTGETVTLEFDVEPDRLRVSRHWISENETVEWNWRLDGNEVELGLGNYLYEVTANWSREDRTWGGSAVYRFWATGREESLPSASVAPLEFHSLDELAAAVVNSEANERLDWTARLFAGRGGTGWIDLTGFSSEDPGYEAWELTYVDGTGERREIRLEFS